MANVLKLFILSLSFTLSFAPVATSLSWNFWNPFIIPTAPPADRSSEGTIQRISHQAASNPHQDVLVDYSAWFDTDGTPLFYNAWRAKPGLISSEPTERSSVMKYGARVACWPSSGGIWIKHAELVDLDFLGLNRFSNTPRQFNQTAEDQFCTTLKMVGAEWWNLPSSFEKREHLGKGQFACDTLETCIEPDVRWEYFIAWPEKDMVACYVPIAKAVAKGGAGLNMYYNARTMEDRCNGIMGLGGKWCKCKNMCPDLEDLDWSFRDPGQEGCLDPGSQ